MEINLGPVDIFLPSNPWMKHGSESQCDGSYVPVADRVIFLVYLVISQHH